MAICKLDNDVIIEDYNKPYIIAEVNSSHNGDVEVAKKMIDAAKEAGCDCVKFQSWSSESLYSKTYYKENPIAKRFVDKFSLSSDQLKEIISYCKQVKIGFSSTPYCEDEVDFLVSEHVPFIKIASMELNNPYFLTYIASKNVPMILSTGMGEMQEIERAVETIEKTGNKQLILLHCVSIYPAEDATINLNNILGLRERFPNYPIGFSDHTLGDTISIGATALGAAVIEKHLTLDKKKIGMDNQMAMEPEDLKVFVERCRMLQIALGSKERCILPEEYEQRKNMRRSLVSVRDISVGDVISEGDLYAKRPGTGISPDRMSELVGKVACKEILADTLISVTDIK